ncbi:MAG: autotransporter outer membrane beta-barrel domain-containing protein [Candidatus Thiodiazotropha taylori]|nr:autotransporter outer membrane beta-barrel domain-containing protein [Candidatus Thiodiazotropha taylori]MCG7924514.1 autotransporter outer membrane beta-barrel domain-containing protein [Candidatus Thiodiazotropha taylori]MCG7934374.1 autotransporter outer membrane beta-barrel domain-containing protein [Candidatus Thiodiazotropha taylori]
MRYRSFAVLAMGLCSVQITQAAETNLGSYGQTQLQQDTGDSVQRTCIGFVMSGALPGTIPLFDTCSAMVQTANELSDIGSFDSSLGLDADELADALQQIATEEYTATGTLANEAAGTRMDPLISRLTELRSGARGFSISGLNINNSQTLVNRPGYVGQGGSAGDPLMDNALSGFATINSGVGEKDANSSSAAFDYDNYRLTAGIDYRLSENLVFGGALSYNRIDTEFDNTATVSGGDLETDGWGGALYGSFYKDRYYLDTMVSYATSDYDMVRNIYIPSNTAVASINESAKASTDSSDYAFSIGGGYTINQGPISFGPYGRATYMRVDIDSYKERGADASGLNFSVDDQEWTSLTSVLGAEFSYAISSQQAVIIPQARLGWVHQFENDQSEITASYINDPRNNRFRVLTSEPDRNYFELNLSVSSVLQDGLQLFVNYDTLLGLEDLSDHQFTLGGRLEF